MRASWCAPAVIPSGFAQQPLHPPDVFPPFSFARSAAHTPPSDGDHFDIPRFRQVLAVSQGRGDSGGGQRTDEAGEALHEVHRDFARMVVAQIPHRFRRRQLHQFAADHLGEFRGGRADQAGRLVHRIGADAAQTGLEGPPPHHRTTIRRFRMTDFLFGFGGEASALPPEGPGRGIPRCQEMSCQGGSGIIDFFHQENLGFQHGGAGRDRHGDHGQEGDGTIGLAENFHDNLPPWGQSGRM